MTFLGPAPLQFLMTRLGEREGHPIQAEELEGISISWTQFCRLLDQSFGHTATEFDLREALQQLVDSRQFQGSTIDFLQAMDQVLGYFKTPLDETSKLHFCLKGLRKDMRKKGLT